MVTGSIATSCALTIAYAPPTDLKPDPRNARTHSRRQIAELVRSIEAFGFTSPILVDEDLVIIAGHGRRLAAIEAGLESVPFIVLTGLSDTQKRALRLADNKIALESGWDPDLLRIEMAAIVADISFKVDVPGFSIPEIDLMLHPKGERDRADDDLPPRGPPRSKVGDVWALGPHRVGCGDARHPAFMAKVMGGAVADAAFLDPPFNVAIQGHANLRRKHREFPMASGEMSQAEFTTFLRESFTTCAGASRDGAVHFIAMDWRHIDELRAATRDVYDGFLNLCIWNKSNGGMGSLYRSKHELIFVYRVGKAQHYNAVELGRHGRNRTNVWDAPSVNTGGHRSEDLDLHPTVKPVGLVADAIQDVTKPGDVVLDAFLGAGTTLVAAQRTGRVFRGLDLDPAYVDQAIDRWTAITGESARLVISDGWSSNGWGMSS
jgi:DNA modification methylase